MDAEERDEDVDAPAQGPPTEEAVDTPSPVDLPDGSDNTDKVAALDIESPTSDEARDDASADDDDDADFDEQPTKRMGALTEEEAEKVAAAAGKERRSIRVFKRPSSPPKLELQLQTAQFQAQGATPSSPRGKIAVIVLLAACVFGGIVAWALHRPPVRTTALEPRPAPVPPPTPSPSPSPDMEPQAAEPPPETVPEDEASAENELSGPERAEELLEAAGDLQGPAKRALLEEAASADPSNPHAAAALAEFFMETDARKALEWAQQAARLRRRRASYRDLVADAHERLGHERDAASARAAAEALRAE